MARKLVLRAPVGLLEMCCQPRPAGRCCGRPYARTTHDGTTTRETAGGNDARYAAGDFSNMRVKLVVNEPMLCRPTLKQMSAMLRSVVLSSAAARSSRLVR